MASTDEKCHNFEPDVADDDDESDNIFCIVALNNLIIALSVCHGLWDSCRFAFEMNYVSLTTAELFG